MATEVKISQLDAGAALDGTEIVPMVQNGKTVTTTTQEIADLFTPAGANGTFTTADAPAKTVTVVNGLITSIV